MQLVRIKYSITLNIAGEFDIGDTSLGLVHLLVLECVYAGFKYSNKKYIIYYFFFQLAKENCNFEVSILHTFFEHFIFGPLEERRKILTY